MVAAATLARPFPLCTGIATVVRRRALTPRMARFTLQAPAFAELGVEQPGEILTLGWCDAGEDLAPAGAGLALPPGEAGAALAQLHGARSPARGDGGRRGLLPPRGPRARGSLGGAGHAGGDGRLRRSAPALAAGPGRRLDPPRRRRDRVTGPAGDPRDAPAGPSDDRARRDPGRR